MDAVENTPVSVVQKTSVMVILACSAGHFCNDLMQFLLPALYPLFKDAFGLSYVQIGLLTLAQQMTASILQPAVGLYGDLKPKPYWLATSMVFALVGVILLATADNFWLLVLAAAVLVQIGVGIWQAREGLPEILVGIHMVLASLSAAAYTVVVLNIKQPVVEH